MAQITAARINNLQSRINLILGNGSGETGYGQSLQSTQVTPDSIIQANDMNAIYADIIKARIHQVGPSDSTVTSIAELLEDQNIVADETSFIVSASGQQQADAEGTKKGLSDFEGLMTAVENDKQLIHPSQASLESIITSTRTNIWNGLIYHEFVVTFPNNDIRRHFFNTGGEIRIDPSNSSASTPKGLDWAALCNEIGIVKFTYDSTTSTGSGSGTSIGGHDLTYAYQTIFNKVGSGSYSGVYAGNTFTIKARHLNAEQSEFRVEFNDIAVDGSIDNNVDGTLRNAVSLYRATGDVNVASPGVFSNVNLSGATPSSEPRYVLTPSSSSVNEGTSFTVTLSTFSVPTGTNVPYTISGLQAGDLVSGSLTGAFTTNSNGIDVASFTVIADATTEGVEYFDMRLDSNFDAIRVTINDASQTVASPTYSLSPSAASVNEGGAVAFILTTTNVPNATRVPYQISGIEREDLSDGTYSWNDWYDEFSTSYLNGYSRQEALLAKDFVFPYYNSNNRYNTVYGTRYGLFRLPDAAGIAYWSELKLSGVSDTEWNRVFWSGVNASNRAIQWSDANGTETDSARSLTPNKNYLIGTGTSSDVYSWDDWYDEYKNTFFSGFTKEQVLTEKDYIINLYQSNDAFSTSMGTKYGLYRKARAEGVAYWVNDLTAKGIPRATTLNNFFYSASLATRVQSDGQTDAARILTPTKEFLDGGVGAVVSDRGEYGVVGDRGTPGGGLSTDLSAFFTVYQNAASVTYLAKADYLTEGNQTMTIALTQVPSVTSSITVNDTSISDPSIIGVPVTEFAPVINSLTFSRASIIWGDPTAVQWSTSGAISVTVSLSGVNLAQVFEYTGAEALSGNTNDFIINQEDGLGIITATLTAVSGNGLRTTATQTIQVLAPAPSITSYYTNPVGDVQPGTPIRLEWSTANAISGTITTNYGVSYSSIDLPNGVSGATTFTAAQLGNKIATLTLTNASAQTVAQTVNFDVITEVVPDAPEWLIAPEWAGLSQTVAFGTTGRGFLQADGSVDTAIYTITGPSGNIGPITADYTAGGFYYTDNYAFTQQGEHTLSMQVTGTGGSITATDSVTVLAP